MYSYQQQQQEKTAATKRKLGEQEFLQYGVSSQGPVNNIAALYSILVVYTRKR
jgi:hypothetical protein